MLQWSEEIFHILVFETHSDTPKIVQFLEKEVPFMLRNMNFHLPIFDFKSDLLPPV